MVVLQSMWKGPNHIWNFMESESESATYTCLPKANNREKKEKTKTKSDTYTHRYFKTQSLYKVKKKHIYPSKNRHDHRKEINNHICQEIYFT